MGDIDEFTTDETIAALEQLLRRATDVSDGHLTLMRFTTGWKVFLESPVLNRGGKIARLPRFMSLREACLYALSTEETPCTSQ